MYCSAKVKIDICFVQDIDRKMSSTSSSSNDNSVRIRDYATAKTSETTSVQAAESIKNVAMGIVEASSSIRELVLTLHQSGAIEEIARTARAIRDTANEINDTVKNLNERGIVKDTASAVEETTYAARDTIHTVKDATREAADTAPTTIKTLKEISDKVRSKVTENKSSD
jgi:gas vesicle protein